MELDVVPSRSVPKSEILRVERAFGDHRIRMQESPVNAVGRLKRQ